MPVYQYYSFNLLSSSYYAKSYLFDNLCIINHMNVFSIYCMNQT